MTVLGECRVRAVCHCVGIVKGEGRCGVSLCWDRAG